MTAQQSLDAFLKHSTRSSDFAKHLRGWKKRNPPAVNTFLHTRAPIIALWQHNFPKLVTREDERKNSRIEVWGGTINCMESEDVLRRQYNRDSDDDREHYPMVCPMCRTIETVRTMVGDGTLAITAPVFVFEGTDPQKSRTITAGGLFNAFSDEDKLDSAQLKAMRAAGISPRDAWMENAYAKCNYVFTVVDADDLASGVMVATETTLLGDKVKTCINDELTGQGDEDGNPLVTPYCIRWEHRPREQEFGKRYHALAMRKVPVTDELLKLIVEQDPPSTDHITEPPNLRALRAMLEQHCKVDLPWDEIFGPAEDAAGDKPPEAGPDVPTHPDAKPLELTEEKPAPEPEKPAPAEAAAEDDDIIVCDECEAEMAADQFVCPGCGVEYNEEGEIIKRPPKKKTRKSRKAAAQSKASKKPAEDDIPF